MSNPKFILTRFTHGAAGKLLSTVLQTSDKVDHWSAIIQDNKINQTILDQLTLEYVSRSFPKDHTMHLRSEPMVPYNTDLYSTGFSRGNDLTLDQYLKHVDKKQDVRLFRAINNNLIINLIFNKPQVPIFCYGSDVVTITVTTKHEQEWLYKTLWSKHFLEINETIRYLPSDPYYCNYNSLVPVLTFNNPYSFAKQDKDKLYEKYVINNHTNPWYFDPDQFEVFDTEHKLNNHFVRLDEILSVDKFLNAIKLVFDKFNLGNPNLLLIKQMHQTWLSRQIPYDYH
jgi:hypothetical protein